MNCQEARDQLARKEGALRSKEDAGILEHLATCQSCRHFRTALQDEDRVLKSALAFSKLDPAQTSNLERRTLAILPAGSGRPDGLSGLLLQAVAAMGGVALVSLMGIETEPLRAQLQDALLQSGSPAGGSMVVAASLLSALLGIAAGLLCRGLGPLDGGSI